MESCCLLLHALLTPCGTDLHKICSYTHLNVAQHTVRVEMYTIIVMKQYLADYCISYAFTTTDELVRMSCVTFDKVVRYCVDVVGTRPGTAEGVTRTAELSSQGSPRSTPPPIAAPSLRKEYKRN